MFPVQVGPPWFVRIVAFLLGAGALVVCVLLVVDVARMSTSGQARYKPHRAAVVEVVYRTEEPEKFRSVQTGTAYMAGVAGVLSLTGLWFFRRLGQ